MSDDSLDGLDDFDLHEVFTGQEAILRAELTVGKQAGHPGVQGDATEDHWIELLRKRLPRRYDVTRAIVVDSTGHRSHQMDLVVHDRHFSPLWWEQGDHHYVPAGSVYAVFEVKPEISRDYVLYASKKIASVRRLERTAASFGWAMGVMNPRPTPPPILGGLLASDSGWSPAFGQPFRKALEDAAPTGGALDLGCVLGHGGFEIPDSTKPGEAIVSQPGVALVSFLLGFLHRLQGLGSAPAIDFIAYARWTADEGEVDR
jgi:hypothetical protein